VLGFAIVPQKGTPTLFVHKQKISTELKKGLTGIAKVADVATLIAELRKLGAAD
jgi:Xaa-Pro aminopeptidase